MKKIIMLLVFVVLSNFNCGSDIEGGYPTPYRLGFQVKLKKVKDPEVKYIKVAIKNIDRIVPKYEIDLYDGADHYDMATGAYFSTQQRKARTVSSGETYYFRGISVFLRGDNGYYTLGKYRIFELKIYKNDDLFLTKKITLRTGVDPELKHWWSEDNPNSLSSSGYTDKVEVDNRDYVKEINVGDRGGRALVIEIPDKPIKK